MQKAGNNGTEKLLSTLDRVSCTNYFMSIEITRCSVRRIETTKPDKKQSVAKSHCIFSIWRNNAPLLGYRGDKCRLCWCRECKLVVRTSSWGSILRVSHLSHHTRTRHNYNYVEPVHVTMIDWVCAINSVAASGDKTAYALLWERWLLSAPYLIPPWRSPTKTTPNTTNNIQWRKIGMTLLPSLCQLLDFCST